MLYSPNIEPISWLEDVTLDPSSPFTYHWTDLKSQLRPTHGLIRITMMGPKEHVLQEILQWLICYFTMSRIQEGIDETWLAKKDPAEEENEER